MGFLHAPGVAGGGVLVRGNVEAGQDLHHPRQGLGAAHVHGLHPAVGDGAVENPGLQNGTGAQIIGESGAAGDLVKGVHPLYASSNFHQAHLLCPHYTVSPGKKKEGTSLWKNRFGQRFRRER